MLESFFRKYNFNVDGKLHYGNFNGRIVSFVVSGSYLKIAITFNKPLQREQGESCSLKLKELKEQFNLIQQAIVSNVSIEILLYQSNDLEEEIEKVLTKTIEIVDQFQDCGIETCPLCGQVLTTDCPFIRIKDMVLQAHEHCIVQLEGATTTAKKAISIGKEGFGKAFLIMLLSMIAIVSLIFLLGFANLYNWFCSLSGWFFLLLVGYLFRKMKILRDKPVLITMIITSILTIILSVYLGSIADIYLELKENYTLGYVFTHYISILKSNVEYFKYMMMELGIGLIMIAIVCFLTYRQFYLFGKNSIKRLSK